MLTWETLQQLRIHQLQVGVPDLLQLPPLPVATHYYMGPGLTPMGLLSPVPHQVVGWWHPSLSPNTRSNCTRCPLLGVQLPTKLPWLSPLLKQHLPGTRGDPECLHCQGREAGGCAASSHLALQPSAQAHSSCQSPCLLLPGVDGLAVVHLCRKRSTSCRCLAREEDRWQGGSWCSLGLSQVSKWLPPRIHCVNAMRPSH